MEKTEITPELIEQHGLNEQEYQTIRRSVECARAS